MPTVGVYVTSNFEREHTTCVKVTITLVETEGPLTYMYTYSKYDT